MPALRPASGSRGPLLSSDELSTDPGGTDALLDGELHVEGRLVDASNATLFCRIGGTDGMPCIYKPIAGERPLWDFPDGTLAGREVATYRLAQELGLSFIPPTVLREGPYGPGMVQTWIDADPEVELVQLVRDDDGDVALTHSDSDGLRAMAVFDALVNNADRKGSHVFVDRGGALYGVDHGLCLHAEPKLRTVLWGWASQPLGERELALLDSVIDLITGSGAAQLAPLITEPEIDALLRRAVALREQAVFPEPRDEGPALPWPPV